MKKIISSFFMFYFLCINVHAQSFENFVNTTEGVEFGVRYVVIFRTKSALDRFDLQGFKSVDYAIDIACSVSNLSFLNNLEYVKGLSIYGKNVISLQGVNNIRKIGKGGLYISEVNISDLDGFQNLEIIEGSLDIKHCLNLKSLNGLQKLNRCGQLSVKYCPSLISLRGLESLKYVYSIEFDGCENLSTISSLCGLNAIGCVIEILNCSNLQALTGLENVHSFGVPKYGHSNMTPQLIIGNCKNLKDFSSLKNIITHLPEYTNFHVESFEGKRLTVEQIQKKHSMQVRKENENAGAIGVSSQSITEPRHPEGKMELLNFLAKNMKYPTLAQENSIKGKVVVQFVVNEDGKLSDFKVIKSVHQYLDNEALRVVKLLPKFIPALDEQGNPVKAYVTIPLMFGTN